MVITRKLPSDTPRGQKLTGSQCFEFTFPEAPKTSQEVLFSSGSSITEDTLTKGQYELSLVGDLFC